MQDRPPNPRRNCPAAGLTRATLLALLASVAILGAGVVAVVVLRDDGGAVGPVPRDMAQEEMVALQEAFKRFMENRLDFVDLLPDAKAYTRKYPEQVAGHIMLAQVLMKMELYGDAYPALATALTLEGNEDNFELRKLTGTCAAKLHLWEDAERHLTAADALRADDITVVLQLGNLFFQTGRLDEAEAAYERAKRISSTSPPHKAIAGLAEVYAAREDYENALKQISSAIRWAEDDSEAEAWAYQLKKVRILFDMDQWDAGDALLIKTQHTSPEATYTLPCTRLRARLHGHHGDPLTAARDYELLLSGVVDADTFTDAERADIYAELAHWHLEAGNSARAREALVELRRIAPGHAQLAGLERRVGDQP